MAITDGDRKRLSKEPQKVLPEYTAAGEQREEEAGRKTGGINYLQEPPAPPQGENGLYRAEGGTGKIFTYDPATGGIRVQYPPDAEGKSSSKVLHPGEVDYEITYEAMELDTGYDFSKTEIEQEPYRYTKEDVYEALEAARADMREMEKERKAEEIMRKMDELRQEAEAKQRKAEEEAAVKNRGYESGYLSKSGAYGKLAEEIAAAGLSKSGYREYSYEEFKREFERQTAGNMAALQSLRQEIRMGLQIALEKEDLKLEKVLRQYRENLNLLEQEYLANTANNKEKGSNELRSAAGTARTAGTAVAVAAAGIAGAGEAAGNGVADEVTEAGSAAAGAAAQSGMGGGLENGIYLVEEGFTNENGEYVPAGSFIIAYNGNELIVRRSDSNYGVIEGIYKKLQQGTAKRREGFGLNEASSLPLREVLEALNLRPDYRPGALPGESSIIIRDQNNEAVYALYEGQDYYLDAQGRAVFLREALASNKELQAMLGIAPNQQEEAPPAPEKEPAADDESSVGEGEAESSAGGTYSIYGMDYELADDGYGMLIEVNEADVPKWQNPSWMTSEKKNDKLDGKYGDTYSQWRVTQGFNDKTTENFKGHLGIDMVPQDLSKEGASNIYPIFPGEVVYVETSRPSEGNGVYVVIKHEINGVVFYSAYGHMKEGSVPNGKGGNIEIKEGTKVTPDTMIGIMGGTGKNNGIHLHLAVFTVSDTSYNRFFGYYSKNEEENNSIPEGVYYSRSNKSANEKIYYDPLKVMQSNGLIIYYNENDKHASKQKAGK